MTEVAHILLGAALVIAGALVAGLADRIRGARHRAPSEPRRSTSRTDRAPEFKRPAAPEMTGPERARANMAKEVTTALTQMGYDKAEATAAVNACTSSESSTLEAWIRAALKQMMKRAV
jgi:hypothetical protein